MVRWCLVSIRANNPALECLEDFKKENELYLDKGRLDFGKEIPGCKKISSVVQKFPLDY